MPKSAFDYNDGNHGVQPGLHTLGVGKNIFDFYESRGDLVSTGPINIPSVQDGPGVVVMYDNLTLNHVLSTTNRCRSLTVLVRGNLVINNGGGISMTARGARGHAGMGLYDGYIPESIDLSSKHLLLADVLKYIKDNAIDVTDRWFWDDFAKQMGVNATFNQGGALILLSAAGCGAGGIKCNHGSSHLPGVTGTAGTNGGCGGGGGGSVAVSGWSSKGGSARPWGGGTGGCGISANFPYVNSGGSCDGDDYGGKGGSGGCEFGGDTWCQFPGAGNPAGTIDYGAGAHYGTVQAQDGTGGVLRIIVKGTITINSGGIIQADGMSGGGSSSGNYKFGGGCSGGGHISLISPAAPTNNGTVRANGGSAVGASANGASGGAGGAGFVVTKTFSQMGWQ